jgi:hypothetical protein
MSQFALLTAVLFSQYLDREQKSDGASVPTRSSWSIDLPTAMLDINPPGWSQLTTG